MKFKNFIKLIPKVTLLDILKMDGDKVVSSEIFKNYINLRKYKDEEISEIRVNNNHLQILFRDEGKEYFVMHYDEEKKKDVSEIMGINKICREFGVTEKQVLNAVKTGHSLKTMYFDEV